MAPSGGSDAGPSLGDYEYCGYRRKLNDRLGLLVTGQDEVELLGGG